MMEPGSGAVATEGSSTNMNYNNHPHNKDTNNKTMTDVNVIQDDTNAQRTAASTWTENEGGGAPGQAVLIQCTVATSPGSIDNNCTPTAATLSSSDRADQQINNNMKDTTMEVSQNDNNNSAITKASVTFSKDTASSSNDNNDNRAGPLRNVKFAEEGSTIAAVMDANIDNYHASRTPTTPTPNQKMSTYAINNNDKSSSGALPSVTLSSLPIATSNKIHSALPATVSPLSSPVAASTTTASALPATVSPLSSPVAASTTTAKVVSPSPSQQEEEEEVLQEDPSNNSSSQVNNGNNRSATMGTNVAIAPPPQVKEVSVAILQNELDEAPVATTTSSGVTADVPAVVVEGEEVPHVVSPVAGSKDLDNENPDNNIQEDNEKDMNNDDVDVNNAVDEDPSAAVTLSPAWSESTTDDDDFVEEDEGNNPNSSTLHVDFENHKTTQTIPSISLSSSSDSSDDGVVLMMTPSKSDLEHGIILPPSCSSTNCDGGIMRSPSPPRVISPSPSSAGIADTAAAPSSPLIIMSPSYKQCETPIESATTTVATTTPASASFCQLTALPIDALHCIASYLTPMEWSQYGQTCTAASKVGREIFRRVRMHGFRCATEVITAWKLEHLADAKELAALYISTGVPIYPHSLGHSYHTVVWRMGIEAKYMQEKLNKAEEGNNNVNADGEPTPAKTVDKFYDERIERGRDAANPLCSYLEDKAVFILGPDNVPSSAMSSGRWNSMASLQAANNANHHYQNHREQPLVPPAVVAAGDLARPVARIPEFHRSHSLASPSSIPIRSMSQSETIAKSKAPKVVVPVHRHLLDQHLLGRACVDDESGELKTPPVTLSADFFHPHLLLHSMSDTHSRPLTQPPVVTQSRARAPVSTGVDENLMEDPAFQAWAARAAATVHNRLNGAALDDAEELAELQELYSQIFAADRSATALTGAMGDAENPVEGPAGAVAVDQNLAIAPDQEPVLPPQDPAADANLERSLLSTVMPRDGYHSILNSVDVDVYSASNGNAKDIPEKNSLMLQLRARFLFYQRRLEVLLLHGDSAGYEECMLDLWDEFLPITAKIHYHDGHTAVPRISSLQQFLTQPCPKELGIVQCEIERVRISSKKKGVSMKGRLFPTYEYRLFIKDRDHGKSSNSSDDAEEEQEEDNGIRKDTVLMVAKNRGRKHIDTSGVVSLTPSAKKGANNYYLYTPQQGDVDTHFNEVNETEGKVETTGNTNGASVSTQAYKSSSSSQMLLGRLQSNFIGTEFQIYTPKLRKRAPGKPIRRSASMNEAISSFDEDPEYDSGFTSDTGSTSRRRNRFGRLSLRRNSSHVSSPSNGEFMSSRSRSRSKSKQDRRTNRRAIANSAETIPDGDSVSPSNQQPILCEEEDGVITYTANLLGSRPRIMDVCIPKLPQDENAGSVWTKYLESHEDSEDVAPYNRMLSRFKELQQYLESQNDDDDGNVQGEDNEDGQEDFGLLALQNRPPWWNIELGSFVLNFRGRVSVASVKNFQLCDRNDHEHIMLQFGRIQGRHSFTMDYQYPLTAVQAFSIAISSLQSKISFG